MSGVQAMRRQLWGSLVRSGPVAGTGFGRGMSSACGSQIISKGKHAGLSYSECLANDPQYCSFVLGRAHQMGPSYHGFIEYLRSQAGQQEGGVADTPASDVAAESDGGYRYGGSPASADAPGKADGGYHYGGAAGDDGEAVVGFGKHKGLTFRQLLEQEPQYCQWVVKESVERQARGEPPKEAFVSLVGYIQGHGAALAAGTRSSPRPARGSPGGVGAGPAAAGPPPAGSGLAAGAGHAADVPLASATLAFGTKYRDRTFGEVVATDKRYSSYILDQVLNNPEPRSANMVAFALYVQYAMFHDAARA